MRIPCAQGLCQGFWGHDLSGRNFDGHRASAVRAGDIPKEKANDLAIVCSVWLNPSAATDENLDHKDLFEIHRKAMARAIHKAMCHEPSIDWLLENQDSVTHKYYQRGLNGEL